MARRLRDYQHTLGTAIDEVHERGDNGAAGIAATGLGKGDVIASRAKPGTLMVAHREELVTEMAWRVGEHHPGLDVGIVQGDRNQCRFPVISASMKTLETEARRGHLDKPKMVIIDEAHHASNKTYTEILKWAGCFDERNPTPYMGFTATMVRGAPPKKGEKGLGDIWQNVVSPQLDIHWGISHGPSLLDPYVTVGIEENGGVGWLVTPKGVAVRTDNIDLDKAQKRSTKGDYQDGEVGEMVRQDAGQIVDAWLAHAVDAEHPYGRITAAFVPNKEAAFALNDAFNLRGIPAEVVVGTTSRAERGDAKKGTGIYGRLAQGITRVLVGVMVPTEGWDCPQVSCVLWARPTLLTGLWIQGVGRGLRPCPSIGKRDCLVIDVVGAAYHHNLVIAPQLLPGIEYDATDLPQVPCLQCGLLIGQCQCMIDPAAPRGDRRRKLLQPEYIAVDLFAATDVNWQVSGQGHKFIFVPKTKQFIVLYDEPDGTASVGVMGQDGSGARWLHLNTTPSQAVKIGEAEARELNGSGPGLSKKASWRTGSPSDGQIKAAASWGIADPEGMTAGRLSDEISRRSCTRALNNVGVAA